MSTEPKIAAGLPLLELARALRPLFAKGLANDLADFAKSAWPILQPGRPLTWSLALRLLVVSSWCSNQTLENDGEAS